MKREYIILLCLTSDGRPGTSKKPRGTSAGSGRPPIPISNATKRSFNQGILQTEYAGFSSTPDLHTVSTSPRYL